MPVKNMSSPRLELLRKMNPAKSRVRRNLFGMPDHDALKKELELQLKQTNMEMKSTWNFDPSLDRPMVGRFEWEPIEKDEYVPECYRKGYTSKFSKRRSDILPQIDFKDITPPSSPEHIVSVESRLSGVTETDSDTEAEAIALRRENETTPEARVTVRQPKINDFMKIKKRRLSDEDLEERPSKSARNAL